MSISSFSGLHDFYPSCVAELTDDIGWVVVDIELGICPRCEGPLPQLPEFPAGSRVTPCRCIPICRRCGRDETDEMLTYGYISTPGDGWPLATGEIEERSAWYDGMSTAAILSGTTVITEDGASPIANPCNTGGWAQYGA